MYLELTAIVLYFCPCLIGSRPPSFLRRTNDFMAACNEISLCSSHWMKSSGFQSENGTIYTQNTTNNVREQICSDILSTMSLHHIRLHYNLSKCSCLIGLKDVQFFRSEYAPKYLNTLHLIFYYFVRWIST